MPKRPGTFTSEIAEMLDFYKSVAEHGDAAAREDRSPARIVQHRSAASARRFDRLRLVQKNARKRIRQVRGGA